MRQLLGLAAVATLVLAGCSDDAADPEPTGPPPHLQGPAIASDGDSIWIAGGTVVDDDLYARVTRASVLLDEDDIDAASSAFSHEILRYATDGTLQERMTLPEGVSPRLYDMAAYRSGDTTLLVGQTCESTVFPNCTTEQIVAVALLVRDGRAEAVDLGPLPSAHTGQILLDVELAGGAGDLATIVLADMNGYLSDVTGAISARRIDLRTGEVATVPLPSGLIDAKHVCTTPAGPVVAVIPVLDSTRRLAGIDVWEAPASGQPFAPTGHLDRTPQLIFQGALHCTDDRLALLLTDSQNVEIDLVDHDTLTLINQGMVENGLLAPSWLVGDDVLLLERTPTGFELAMLRWEAGKAGTRRDDVDSYSSAVLVEGKPYDVTDLAKTVPGEDGPAARLLEV